MTTSFVPRWSSPPGDTIRQALDEQELKPAALAAALDLPAAEFQALLSGVMPLTLIVAEGLSTAIGGSVEYWITRDAQYREDQARVVADDWAQRMPIKDMVTYGWVPHEARNWVEQIDLCLDFFGVSNPEIVESELVQRARFRTSPRVSSDDFAVAAWLRQCEIELSEIPCASWDGAQFKALLVQLLPLTRERDPAAFLPMLRDKCAAAGVAVGVIRAPHGCPVSGAARRLPNGTPSIALSGRHLADDHFWFTFFHEAAHLVLHDVDEVYLDEIEGDPGSSVEEKEADDFAGTILVSREYETRVAAAKEQPFRLRTLAEELGVSPGILVGHLQHRGVLPYASRLNRLKRRYSWRGTNLGKV